MIFQRQRQSICVLNTFIKGSKGQFKVWVVSLGITCINMIYIYTHNHICVFCFLGVIYIFWIWQVLIICFCICHYNIGCHRFVCLDNSTWCHRHSFATSWTNILGQAAVGMIWWRRFRCAEKHGHLRKEYFQSYFCWHTVLSAWFFRWVWNVFTNTKKSFICFPKIPRRRRTSMNIDLHESLMLPCSWYNFSQTMEGTAGFTTHNVRKPKIWRVGNRLDRTLPASLKLKPHQNIVKCQEEILWLGTTWNRFAFCLFSVCSVKYVCVVEACW